MNEENKEDMEQVLPSGTSTEVSTQVETEVETSKQDPLKTELEKVQSKGRTKADKLLYTKKRVEEQLKELGIDEEPEDDEKPMTVGMFKKLQSQTATQTALELADQVTNETERELLKYHIEHTIKSTGDAKEDFKLAQNQVNAVKNSQILEEMERKTTPATHASGSGAPAKVQKQEEFTAEELSYMRPPFNLTKEQVLKARPS